MPECLEKEPNNQPGGRPTGHTSDYHQRSRRSAGRLPTYSPSKAAPAAKSWPKVYARRLNSPVDSVLRLTDAAGKQLAVNDDHEDKGMGLNTHHDRFLPARHASHRRNLLRPPGRHATPGADPNVPTVCALARPSPTFELRAVPSSIMARGFSTVPIGRVCPAQRTASRGEITIKPSKDAPPGLSVRGAVIPADQDRAQITFTVPTNIGKGPFNLKLEGQATINGRDVVHSARAGRRHDASLRVPPSCSLQGTGSGGHGGGRWQRFHPSRFSASRR